MKFNLISQTSQVSDYEAYRKVGFNVSEQGVISELEISIDTDTDLFYKGYSRRDIITRLRETLGKPININGPYWTILNQ